MKKMLWKGLLFTVILLLPMLYLNMRYKETNYYLQLNGLGKFRKVPNGITTLNLGNSHEQAGIVYNEERSGYNLALASQPFEYDYYVLDQYSSCLADGATVLIPISYFDWHYAYEELFLDEISVYNERYYSILDKSHIMNYDWKKDLLYHWFPLLTAGENMKYIFEDIAWVDFAEDHTIVADIDAVASYKHKSWTEDVMATDADGIKEAKKRNQEYLKKTIDFCYEHGYRPVLITLPVTNQLTELFSQEFLKDFRACTQEVLACYPGLEYLDYSKDQEFAGNLKYFKDSDHLNSNGAAAFSARLFKDLADRGY